MVILIYGSQNIRIKSQIKKIVNSTLGEDVDEMNFAKIDASQTLVQDIVDEASYLPLGYERKVIEAYNCYFLGKPVPRNKIESEQNYQKLCSYIANSNPDCDLILTFTIDEKHDINLKSNIYNIIKEKGKIIPIIEPDVKQWKDVVSRYVENLKIDYDAKNELADRTGGDYAMLRNSVQVLSLYTDHITLNDVMLMVPRPLEDNTFQIFNFLLQGKNSSAIATLRDLQVNNVEPVTLISTLANQFRLLNEVIFLSKKGLDNASIAKELNIKEIRVQILKKNTYTVSEKKIHETLNDLYKLDLQIKSGQIDRYYGFELFLINFETN